MKQLNNYILEKLHINKDSKVYKENPFNSINADNAIDLLDEIVGKCENEGFGNPMIWNDTKNWHAEDDFENFNTQDGTSIDWLTDFTLKVNYRRVAMWDVTQDKKSKINNHPFVKFFESTFEEEVLYSKSKYYVKYWGWYKYKENKNHISMLRFTPYENGDEVICFVIDDNEKAL